MTASYFYTLLVPVLFGSFIIHSDAAIDTATTEKRKCKRMKTKIDQKSFTKQPEQTFISLFQTNDESFHKVLKKSNDESIIINEIIHELQCTINGFDDYGFAIDHNTEYHHDHDGNGNGDSFSPGNNNGGMDDHSSFLWDHKNNKKNKNNNHNNNNNNNNHNNNNKNNNNRLDDKLIALKKANDDFNNNYENYPNNLNNGDHDITSATRRMTNNNIKYSKTDRPVHYKNTYKKIDWHLDLSFKLASPLLPPSQPLSASSSTSSSSPPPPHPLSSSSSSRKRQEYAVEIIALNTKNQGQSHSNQKQNQNEIMIHTQRKVAKAIEYEIYKIQYWDPPATRWNEQDQENHNHNRDKNCDSKNNDCDKKDKDQQEDIARWIVLTMTPSYDTCSQIMNWVHGTRAMKACPTDWSTKPTANSIVKEIGTKDLTTATTIATISSDDSTSGRRPSMDSFSKATVWTVITPQPNDVLVVIVCLERVEGVCTREGVKKKI